MKIAFYETKDEERSFFQSRLKGHELHFFEGTIQEELGKSEDFEAVSLFVGSRITDELLDRLPKLRYIQTRSSGYDHIKCTQLYRRHLIASNVAGYAGPAVAEFAFSLLLNGTRRTHIALERAVRGESGYLDLKGVELYGKTAGILGLGTIGLQMARIAGGFGMHILGYSRTKKALFDKLGIEFTGLDRVLKESDILLLALPLTPSTQNIINSENSSMIKENCIIVNVARGEIIETPLYRSLPNIIACDVCGEISLAKKKDFLYTPHMAYYTAEALERILEISLENMEQFIRGEVPRNCLKMECEKNYG